MRIERCVSLVVSETNSVPILQLGISPINPHISPHLFIIPTCVFLLSLLVPPHHAYNVSSLPSSLTLPLSSQDMKIQCDVCSKEEASVFCSADEAALCTLCDHRVHLANKLASKHHRFSLLNPAATKDAPLCDICQEKRAFLFCREDRAILCRECDIPIHTANEHTRKHNRFLLTGVKLAATTLTSSSNACVGESNMIKKKNLAVSISTTPPPSIESPTSTPSKGSSDAAATSGGGSTSSIAEYLIETLPGWHVEDFLDSSSVHRHGFCKNFNASPFLDGGHEKDFGDFDTDDLGIWVPQAPTTPSQLHPVGEQRNGVFKQMNDVNKPNSIPKMTKRWNDDGYTVPQISPPSNKRSRSFW